MKANVNYSTEKGQLTVVKDVPLPELSDDEILIKSVAFAANPTDWKSIVWGYGIPNAISGSDVSGIVEKVGKNVTGFEKGDVVSSMLRTGSSTTNGAFAEYVVVSPITTIKFKNGKDFQKEPLKPGLYPAAVTTTFEGASSLNLALATVVLSYSYGLKIKNDSSSPNTILIWSGASSVGVLAIQVAKKVFGLKVITTASIKHEQFLKELGADAVFDYRDADVVKKIRAYANGSIAYAYDTFSEVSSMQAIYDATADSPHVAIDNLLSIQPEQLTLTDGRSVSFSYTLVYQAFKIDFQSGNLFSPYTPELGESFDTLWVKVQEYLPEIKHHNLQVLEPGLETTNEALELLRDNKVSGAKLVWHI